MARPGPKWTARELRYLQRVYADTMTPEIAQKLGRPLAAVYAKAQALGLRKSLPHMRQHGTRLLTYGKGTRFQAGLKPWNKGTRYVAGGRSAETRFKPGRRAEESHNYRPIGSERVISEYLERKVSDDPALKPARRWVAVHRLVWEAANGPIPRGYAVAFLPGCHTTVAEEITLDKLELVSRQELMRRNTVQRYPQEIKETIRAVAVLRRKINQRTRNEESNGRPA